MNKGQNKCVDAEKSAGARVLLTQHPRPSLISGHDRRYLQKKHKIAQNRNLIYNERV